MRIPTQCWLMAGAVFVALALLALPGRWAMLGLLWAFVVFPLGAVGIERFRGRRSGRTLEPVPDVAYWRTSNWGAGRR